MKNIYPASGIQISYLEPLKQWRILDLKKLMKKSNYELGYVGFTKIVASLEKKNLVGSFRDPFSRKKYLYLTDHGNDYLGGSSNPPAIIKETLVHDAKTVEIVSGLLRLKTLNGFELEHKIKDSNSFGATYKVCPDAIMFGEKDGVKFKIAVELELTRKTKSKYLAKAGQYIDTSYYDFILYFFQNKGVMNSYRNHIRDMYGNKSDTKILYVLNEELLTKNFIFENSIAHYKNKEGKLDALF